MLVESILPHARGRLAVIEQGASVKEAAGMMAKPHVDLLVVCNSNVLTGVVTKTDIVAHISRNLEPGLVSSIDTVMARDVVFCTPTDPLLDLWKVMQERGFQRVPVVSGMRNPIGVAYARDVLQGLLREAEIEDELLRDYIAGAGFR